MLDLLEETCQGCGCTDNNACWDEENNCPCHWVEPRLCSVCFRALQEPEGGADVS